MSTDQIVAYAEHFGLHLDTWQERALERLFNRGNGQWLITSTRRAGRSALWAKVFEVHAAQHIALIGMIRDGKTQKQLGTECTAPPVRLISPCRCRYDVRIIASLAIGDWPPQLMQPIWHEDEIVGWGVLSFRIHPRCPHHGDTAYMCTCVGPIAGRGLPCPTHRIGVR